LDKHRLFLKRKVYGKSAFLQLEHDKAKHRRLRKINFNNKSGSEVIWDHEVREEVNQKLNEIYEYNKVLPFHIQKIHELLYKKRTINRKKIVKILYSEEKIFENKPVLITKLKAVIKKRSSNVQLLLDLEKNFTEISSYEDNERLIEHGKSIIRSIRSLTLLFLLYFKKWLLYLQYLRRIDVRPQDKYKELEKREFDSPEFIYNNVNYFNTIFDESLSIFSSKWEKFFNIVQFDITLKSTGDSKIKKGRRLIEMTEKELQLISKMYIPV